MLVPKLRFKREDGTDYPEWGELPMSEVFTEIIEKNRPDLPVLSILQGQGTVYRDSSDRNIQYDKKSTSNYKAMKKGDFIIHLRTFEGGLECATLNGISSPAYKVLRTDKLVPEAYKAYFRSRQFIDGRLAIAVTGVRDGKNIEMSTFWQILVPVACLEEQQKIADFLSTVDEVIAQSEAEVQNLEQQKKAAMQKIFSQEVRFKREDGTEYPEWEEKKFGTIMDCYSGGTPSSKNKQYYNGKIPFIRSGEIHFSETELFLSEEGLNKSAAKMVKVGDLLYALYGATSGEVDISKINGAINQAILCIIPYSDNRLYLKFWLESFKTVITTKLLQGGQGNLSAELIKSLRLPIPHIEEQQKIADFLSAYDEAINYAKQELDKWKELKKGLLQQMFV